MVGAELARKLTEGGHTVKIGSRTRGENKVTFEEAAQFGEVVLNCTSGTASLQALSMAGAQNLAGKILIDVSNPLDFSKGMPPTLSVCNDDSLGEQIQRAFPDAKVVKALNTLNVYLMTNPQGVAGEQTLFVCGNDAAAKAQVTTWLGEWFGWPARMILDVGDITAARGTEMLMPLWIRLYGKFKTGMFNWHIAK